MMRSIQQFYQDCLVKFALMGESLVLGVIKKYLTVAQAAIQK